MQSVQCYSTCHPSEFEAKLHLIILPTLLPNFLTVSPLLPPSSIQLAAESIPKFMCHYYNHYFAHTAGGRMIGRRMADKLLESNTLKFYQWESGDVKVR